MAGDLLLCSACNGDGVTSDYEGRTVEDPCHDCGGSGLFHDDDEGTVVGRDEPCSHPGCLELGRIVLSSEPGTARVRLYCEGHAANELPC